MIGAWIGYVSHRRGPDDELGALTLPAVVPKLSATPGRIRWAGRRVGQDTRQVLGDLAALREGEIEALEAAGVIHCGRSEEPPAARAQS